MTQKEMEEIDYALMGFLDKKSRLIVIEKMDEIGFTKRPQDNALVPLDRDKLAKILAQHRGGHSGFPPASWDYDLADVICAKFGKDNSGMRNLDYDLIMSYSHEYGDRKDFIRFICNNFSQQPPKERKVSLEEIQNVIYHENRKQTKYLSTIDIHNIAEVVLSLLNATEERKTECI